MEEVLTPVNFYLNLSFVNKSNYYLERELPTVRDLRFSLSETTLGTCIMDACTEWDIALTVTVIPRHPLPAIVLPPGYLITIHSLGWTHKFFPVSEGVSVLLPSC